MVKSPLTKYGTYGFLSALLAAQVASLPSPTEPIQKQGPTKREKKSDLK